MQALPAEVLFKVELFLRVSDVASLAAISHVARARATQRHWQRQFIARWGSQYATKGEGTAALTSTRVSARILGGLSSRSPWRGFWSTVERAFIGHGPRAPDGVMEPAPAAAGGANERPVVESRRGWLIRLFRMVQPPAAPGSCSKGAYRAFQEQPGSAAASAAAAAAPSAPWNIACLLREARRADVVLCRVCDEMDVLTREMRDWEALPTQCSSFVAPCACAVVAHRGCLEDSILLGGGAGACCAAGVGAGGLDARPDDGLASVNSGGGGGNSSAEPTAVPDDHQTLQSTEFPLDDRVATARAVGSLHKWALRLSEALKANWVRGCGPKNWISFDDSERAHVQRFLDPSAATCIADFAAAAGLGPQPLPPVNQTTNGDDDVVSLSGGRQRHGDAGKAATGATPPQASRYRCRRCGCMYKLGWRLPGSMGELVRITCCDPVAWQRSWSVLTNWLALAGAVHALERWRAPVGGEGEPAAWPEPGGPWLLWWLLQQVVLLQVFFSSRFTHVVSQLWRGPIFTFYCRLYLYFAAACLLFTFTWTPLLPRTLPWLVGPTLPLWLVVVGWVNGCCYAIVSSIVIFLFWKTQYRIATVAEGKQSAATTHPILRLRTA